jgi:hypothetical protein
LAEQVASHFKLVRSTFSNFLKRSYFDQLIPLFKEEYSDEHTIQIPMSASNIENLKDSMITFHTNIRYFDLLIKRRKPDLNKVREEVTSELYKNPYLFIDVPEDFYKNIHAYMRLNIVDDIGPDVASLTTLYQALSAKGDPRADTILKMIFAKQGKNLDALAGKPPQQAPAPAPSGQGGAPVKTMMPSNESVPSNVKMPVNA